WPVSTLVVVTMTPGRTAPEESMTVPVRAPVPAVWAMRDGTEIMNRTKQRLNNVLLTIPPPYFDLGEAFPSSQSSQRRGISPRHSHLLLLRCPGFWPALFEARV